MDRGATRDARAEPIREPGASRRLAHLHALRGQPAAPPAVERKKRKRRLTASKNASQFFEQPLEHSIVKAKIISKYFKAWANIIKTRTRDARMAYFDLFAGKGRYDDGTASTPVLIVEAIIADPLLCSQVVTFFADESQECADALRANLDALPGIEQLKYRPKPLVITAAETGIAEHFASKSVIPSFMLLDPFGYEGVTAKLIRAILKDWGCDVAFFFCYRRMPGALRNNKVRAHVDELFGQDRVDQLRAELPRLKPVAQEKAILSALEASLTEIGGRYVQTFRFRNRNGAVMHHLVFVTKHPTAHLIMKSVMANESSGVIEGVANFEFMSNAPQLLLADPSPIEVLIASLVDRFRGRTVTIKDIVAEHHYGTPFVEKNYTEALKRLCYDRGAITAVRGQHSPPLNPEKRSMPADNTFITFPP